ncbi:MAG: UDP binding domain-containing protein, partial [Candidatus Bathyarchaeota archaeon]
GLDQRINPKFLRAGIGYGGSCFPKDVSALIAFSKQAGYSPILLQDVHEINKNQAKHAVEIVKKKLGGLNGKKIAILGLAFKPDTDDMREARSIPIINQLLDENAEIIAYDPVANLSAKTIFGEKIEYSNSAIDCIKNTDCCIIVTEWNEFKQLKPKDFKENMKHPILIDGRRIYNPSEYQKNIQFEAIGLGTQN